MIRSTGAGDLANKLRILADSMYSFEEALDDVGEYWRDQVDMQFALNGAVPGVRGPWAPLAASTIARKTMNKFLPLRHRGDLESSYITPDFDYNVDMIGVSSATFGSAYRAVNNKGKLKPVAMFHQIGTKFMPERPIVLGNRFLDEEILDAYTHQLFKHWPGV